MNERLREFLKGFALGIISLVLIGGLILFIYGYSDTFSSFLDEDITGIIFYVSVFILYTIFPLFILKSNKWFRIGVETPIVLLALSVMLFAILFNFFSPRIMM